MNINLTIEELAVECYRVIRREARSFDRTTNDTELGNFVRGVIELETMIYSEQERRNREELENERPQQTKRFLRTIRIYPQN